MSLRRTLAVGLAVGLGFLIPITASLPASAAANDPAATATAANYLDAQYSQANLDAITNPSDYYFGAATIADGIVALSAAGGHDAAVQRMETWLQANAAAYVGTNPGRAGYIAIAAATLGVNPTTTYTGINPISTIETSIQPTGEYCNPCSGDDYYGASPLSQALDIIGLVRNGETVPQSAIDFLVGLQDPATHLWGYTYGGAFSPDTDSTSYALMALSLVPSTPAVSTAIAAGQAALVALQQSDGSWAAPFGSPVNTTGLAATSLQDLGVAPTAAVSWTTAQLQSDGGLPDSVPGSLPSSVSATNDGLLLLAGGSYATTVFTPTAAAPTTAAPTTAAVTSAAAATTTVAAAPTTDTPTAQIMPTTIYVSTLPYIGPTSDPLANTGFNSTVPLTSGLAAIGIGMLLILAARQTRKPAHARKH